MRQRLAQNAARAATAELRGAMESLSRLGASMIGKIRSAARMEGDGVYAKALMSPPAEPSPIGAPGTPTGFRALLQSDGVMLLKWKCKNPRGSEGTMYEVRRTIGDGPSAALGTVGRKEFRDGSLPAGTRLAVYSVRAIRSTRRGEPATFNVPLGVEPEHLPRDWFRARGQDKNAA